MPEKIKNAPDLLIGLECFYVGFLDLSNSRQYVGFGSEAPLDWFRINEYCKEQGIVGEQREDFFYHIQKLDAVFIDYRTRKMKESSKAKK